MVTPNRARYFGFVQGVAFLMVCGQVCADIDGMTRNPSKAVIQCEPAGMVVETLGVCDGEDEVSVYTCHQNDIYITTYNLSANSTTGYQVGKNSSIFWGDYEHDLYRVVVDELQDGTSRVTGYSKGGGCLWKRVTRNFTDKREESISFYDCNMNLRTARYFNFGESASQAKTTDIGFGLHSDTCVEDRYYEFSSNGCIKSVFKWRRINCSPCDPIYVYQEYIY